MSQGVGGGGGLEGPGRRRKPPAREV